MENCLFCKIISNEIPAYKIYEDDDFLAFLDISQTTKGHTLVIPKKHYRNIYDVDEDTVAKIHQLAFKLAKQITKKLNAQGVNILNNNEAIAGQTIFHYHVHIIPRYRDDDKISIVFNENIDSNIEETYHILK
ncbi:MAG: HIT family protein [Bacilli bacterium]|jgi:histidine triad (HIT) family protein|nr:HIT family protein [Bacilli bacterium]